MYINMQTYIHTCMYRKIYRNNLSSPYLLFVYIWFQDWSLFNRQPIRGPITAKGYISQQWLTACSSLCRGRPFLQQCVFVLLTGVPGTFSSDFCGLLLNRWSQLEMGEGMSGRRVMRWRGGGCWELQWDFINRILVVGHFSCQAGPSPLPLTGVACFCWA